MNMMVPIATGICLSACTGFRAFVPPFLIGLLLKWFPQSVLFLPGMSFLAQTPVLIALGVAVVVEFLADKIPWVDHILDVIQLPIKIMVTTILTQSLFSNTDYHWLLLTLTLVIGNGTTVTVHSGKAGLRAASTTTTGGLMNPIISIFEELIAFFGTLMSLFLPFLALAIFAYVVYRSLRWLFGSTGGNEGTLGKTPPSFWFVKLVGFGCRTLFGIYNGFRIEGAENFPEKGPFIVVANHSSMADGFIIGSSVPVPTFIMVKKEAFDNPIESYLLHKVLAFPVDREKPDPGTIKFAFKVLQDGFALCLFPEGTRSRAGLVKPFKPGALKIAIKQKSVIVPSYITNSHLFWPDGASFPKPVLMKIRFGKPINLLELMADGKTEEAIQTIIYEAVCGLGQEMMGHDVRDRGNDQHGEQTPPREIAAAE